MSARRTVALGENRPGPPAPLLTPCCFNQDAAWAFGPVPGTSRKPPGTVVAAPWGVAMGSGAAGVWALAVAGTSSDAAMAAVATEAVTTRVNLFIFPPESVN
jgi:hypothetical protein